MIIELQGVRVRYGDLTAVEDIGIRANPGAVLGILGANGSGKSSLVKAIAGLVKADGRITFDGGVMRPRTISYMPQEIGGSAALTVTEVVLVGRLQRLGLRVKHADIEPVTSLLTALKISHLAGRYIGELSGGQRQMVFLAQALVGEPRVLLLDEPISALDLRNQLEVLEQVREMTVLRRLTTICVLHDLNAAARFCSSVALLRRGRLVGYGPARDVISPAMIASPSLAIGIGRCSFGACWEHAG